MHIAVCYNFHSVDRSYSKSFSTIAAATAPKVAPLHAAAPGNSGVAVLEGTVMLPVLVALSVVPFEPPTISKFAHVNLVVLLV